MDNFRWSSLRDPRSTTGFESWSARSLFLWIFFSLILQYYADFDTKFIISYGFLNALPHGTVNQRFHYDYSRTSSSLFIPMTLVHWQGVIHIWFVANDVQCTSIYQEAFARSLRRCWVAWWNRYFHHMQWKLITDDIVQKEGCPIEVTQLLVPPFSLLKMLENTAHRGIRNLEDTERIVFFCCVDKHFYKIHEAKTSSRYDAFEDRIDKSSSLSLRWAEF